MTVHRSDTTIKTDILAELKWDPEVEETDIGVIVKDSAVTLTGNVPTYVQKLAACRAAKRVRGVRAIADEIEVKMDSEMAGSDKDVAERIARLFEWNTQIPADTVKAEVRHGYVTLSGDVDWQYQREAAQHQVATIKGVRVVINHLNIRKRANVPDIKNEIVKALHRHASVEAAHVNVSALDGVVTLTGNVDTFFEKDLIKNAAWSAAGVSKVVDNLMIAPIYKAAA